MAVNTYRLPEKNKKGNGFFVLFERLLRIDSTLAEVIHVRFLPQILYVSFLCLLYIGNRHYAEKKTRSIHVLQQRVEDLRADYTTLKADYMFASKQSEVAKKAARLGLQESSVPPEKIVLSDK
ncbi:MAG: FtsL-like putative cell division protein [Cyclobacteriaceae bacterium]|nr:FtsL-like putative cell division protein [Cyclobacteriaceae bacterium]